MRTNSNYEDHCLYREFDVDSFAMANRSNVEECFVKENYTEAWSCYNGYPHGAGHGAVGGLVSARHAAHPRTTLRTNP